MHRSPENACNRTDILLRSRPMAVHPARKSVLQLAHDHPDWVPILRAACVVAKNTEPFGGQFAGRWVLQELARQRGVPLIEVWKPGLRRLVAYGLLENAG